MPKKRRIKNDPDVSQFKPLVDEALRAFGLHMRYAIDISDRANVVINKRARFAEKRAAKKANPDA